MRLPRLRFSLRTLLLFSLLCGSAMLVWRNRAPWRMYRSVRESQDIWSVGFSPRDTYFYTAVSDGRDSHAADEVKIYDRSSGRLRASLHCPFRRGAMVRTNHLGANQYSFSPGEKYFYPQETSTRIVEKSGLWNIATREAVRFEKGRPEELIVSRISDNDSFAVLGNVANDMSLVKLPSLEVIARLPHGCEGFFSPDERWLAFYDTRGARHTMRIYSTATGKEDTRFGWGEGCGAVQFSPDSRMIAYVSGDYHRTEGMQTRIIDLQTGYELHCIPGELEFGGHNFSDDGRMFFTQDSFKLQTRVWDLVSKSPPVSIRVAVYPRINHIRHGLLFHDHFLGAFAAADGNLLWNSKLQGSFAQTGAYAYCSENNAAHAGELLDGATGESVLKFPKSGHNAAFNFSFANTVHEFATFYFKPEDVALFDEVQLWERRRPEAWWGLPWIWEFWLAAALGAAMLWSLIRDR